jgi:hypothetical protein
MLRVAAVLLLSALVASASARTHWSELNESYTFERYCGEFGKAYSGAELAARQAAFSARMARIMAHNADSTRSWRVRRRCDALALLFNVWCVAPLFPPAVVMGCDPAGTLVPFAFFAADRRA